MESISPVQPFDTMFSWSQVSPDIRRRKLLKKNTRAGSSGQFAALARLVDDNHLNLVENQAPFRLCVYQKKQDLFMDVVTMDETKKIDRLYNRSITNDDVMDLVRQIHNGTGLVFDYSL